VRASPGLAWFALALLALAALTSPARGDEAGAAIELVNEEVICPLASVSIAPEGGLVGTVGRGADDGVIEGGRGVVYRLLDSGELLSLGEATVTTVGPTESAVALVAYDPQHTAFQVGDAVYVPARCRPSSRRR